MFGFFKKVKKNPPKKKTEPAGAAGPESPGVKEQSWRGENLRPALDENLKHLKIILADCDDAVFRKFTFAQQPGVGLALVYIDGMVDNNQVNNFIIRALSLEAPAFLPPEKRLPEKQVFDFIRDRALCINQIKETDKLRGTVDAIMAGDTVLLVDGEARAIVNSARGWESRSIEDSKVESLIRGSRESFVETLRVNTSLLRRRIRNPALKIEITQVGEISRTDVAIAYIKGVTHPGLVNEAKKRISRIKIDGVLESGYLEEFISDAPWTPFVTINNTDRVDKVAALLLEGRVAIITDGTPVVLTAPCLFIEVLHSPTDYFDRFAFSSFLRWVRILSLFIFTTAPALYVALLTYHREMLPTEIMLSLAAQRETVPFPTVIEVLLMDVVFEILREAGIHMPTPIGQAVSIVGAIVLGEASVRAGLVMPATVITVALVGISSFTLYYPQTISLRLIRFPLTIAAAFSGLIGVIVSIIMIIAHLASLRSFGVPYLSPLMPLSPEGLKDVPVRAPWWTMLTRPRLFNKENLFRLKNDLKPGPPAQNRQGGD